MREAIKSLYSDSRLVIKEADKGGPVVTMDKDHCKQMINQFLGGDSYYMHLKTEPKKQNRTRFNRMLKTMTICKQENTLFLK